MTNKTDKNDLLKKEIVTVENLLAAERETNELLKKETNELFKIEITTV